MNDLLKINAYEITSRLRNAGYKAYIVGGAVRDMVMGIEPVDYDIATDASPVEVAKLFDRVEPVGERYGVSLVIRNGLSCEVAQFRADGQYKDGRRPSSVTPSDENKDAERRDFTINAMFFDPESKVVIDKVSGRQDITNKIIRAIGDPDERFTEDRLRMLRAVRFAARFNFTIETETLNAIKRNASHICDVSTERIRDELIKMFTGPQPEVSLDILAETGLLSEVLPEVLAMKGVEQPPEFHPEGDVFDHTRLMLSMFGGGSVTLAFAILLHDVGKTETFSVSDRIRFNRHDAVGAELSEQILRRLLFKRGDISRVVSLVKNHMRFIPVRAMRQSTFRRFIAMDGFDELFALYRLDCLVSHGSLDTYGFITDKIASEGLHGDLIRLPDPMLNGNDLIALGYSSGRVIGKILHRITDAQLEGEIVSREEATELVLREYPLDNQEPSQQNQQRKNNRQG